MCVGLCNVKLCSTSMFFTCVLQLKLTAYAWFGFVCAFDSAQRIRLLNSLFHGLTLLPTQGVWLSWENSLPLFVFLCTGQENALDGITAVARDAFPSAAPIGGPCCILLTWGSPSCADEVYSGNACQIIWGLIINWSPASVANPLAGRGFLIGHTGNHGNGSKRQTTPAVCPASSHGRLKWITKCIADFGFSVCQTSAKLIMIADSLFGKGQQNTDSTLERKVVG